MKPLPLPATYRRVILLLIAAAIGVAMAVVLQPWYHTSDEAHSILITVFAVLAGFLLAAMTINARAIVGQGSNSRVAYFQARLARAGLLLRIAIFELYMLIVALMFVDSLKLPIPATAEVWLERLILFLAVVALAGSVKLPTDLVRNQLGELDRLVRERRHQETSRPHDQNLKRRAA